jgi:hypothetical protein
MGRVSHCGKHGERQAGYDSRQHGPCMAGATEVVTMCSMLAVSAQTSTEHLVVLLTFVEVFFRRA